jgi:uncharacterized protein
VKLYREHDSAVLIARLTCADTFLKRLKGLLGRHGLKPDEALLIKPCNSVHMLGMRFSIDAIFVGRDGAIVRIVENLRPWRYAACFYADSVIEMKCGAARALGISKGDVLVWK